MRTATKVVLSLTCATPLVPLALGFLSAVRDYHGVCYGFLDGESPCSFLDYALTEASWATLLLPWLLLPLALAWAGVLIHALARNDTRSE